MLLLLHTAKTMTVINLLVWCGNVLIPADRLWSTSGHTLADVRGAATDPRNLDSFIPLENVTNISFLSIKVVFFLGSAWHRPSVTTSQSWVSNIPMWLKKNLKWRNLSETAVLAVSWRVKTWHQWWQATRTQRCRNSYPRDKSARSSDSGSGMCEQLRQGKECAQQWLGTKSARGSDSGPKCV